MSVVSSVILDRWAKIQNCPIYSSALPVCLRVRSLAHAFPGISEIRNVFSSACLHATQVPRFIFPFASVFCVMKDSFQAWAGLLFIKDRAKMIFLLSLLYTSWLRVRYRVTSWRKGPALLCNPENSFRRLILISLGCSGSGFVLLLLLLPFFLCIFGWGFVRILVNYQFCWSDILLRWCLCLGSEVWICFGT